MLSAIEVCQKSTIRFDQVDVTDSSIVATVRLEHDLEFQLTAHFRQDQIGCVFGLYAKTGRVIIFGQQYPDLDRALRDTDKMLAKACLGWMTDTNKSLVQHFDMSNYFSYDTPDQLPEWGWIEQHAQMLHRDNGNSGVWEYLLNLSVIVVEKDNRYIIEDDIAEAIPEKLADIILKAAKENVAYLLFHQGT